jgi:hypothetical protein
LKTQISASLNAAAPAIGSTPRSLMMYAFFSSFDYMTVAAKPAAMQKE